MKKNIKYTIGLDIGTSSVGYSVVNNETYQVIKKGNKSLWGVRLFDEADYAKERRFYRSSRRRFDRRRNRIKILQEEFKSEINKVDSNFFNKLKEFALIYEDKNIKLSDIDKYIYNKNFKTIYHLRNYLIQTNEKVDIRLIYLAVHHIIKYRGNFLYDGKLSISSSKMTGELDNVIIQKINDLFSYIYNNDVFDISYIYENNDYKKNFLDKFRNYIYETNKKDKSEKIKKLLKENNFEEKVSSEISKFLVGYKGSFNKLFNIDSNEQDKSFSFDDSNYDDIVLEINSLDKYIETLNILKELYDAVYLKSILGNCESISSAMILNYENHKKDLKDLKKIYKYNNEAYKKMFKDKKERCIYTKYIKNNITYDEFKNIIKKDLDNFKINDDAINNLIGTINDKLTKQTFMPKITTPENSKLPYQLNEIELIRIIENQGKYYPFLLDKLEDNKYKLVKLLEFRIPYYVGPLNNTTSIKNKINCNSWVIKNEGFEKEKITPFNFEKVVNLEKCAEEFILRMVGKCSYLFEENALASNSILYCKFKVLNELKQISIKDKNTTHKIRLDIETINKIYKELFLKKRGTITEKVFVDFLKNNNILPMIVDYDIDGYSANHKFANNMKSYIDFFGENGVFVNTKYNENDAENIIKYITIFEDKKILKEKIKKEYNELNEEKINMICTFKYKGWGNLSKKLLTEIETVDNMNIISTLQYTTKNFQQILFDKQYKMQEKIANINNSKTNKKISYDLVDNLYTSPANKKGIYQSLLVLNELIDYIGYEPENIVIEMIRSEEKKVRKDDRKEKLLKLYKNYKNSIEDYSKLSSELDSCEKLSDKLYLYFIQNGRSLYSQKPLNIYTLEEDCEIDHIIPRCLIKDDSIDNKALILKEENQIKADSFVLPQMFRNENNMKWWNSLKDMDLISSKKYSSLCRSSYSNDIINNFINRQLVQTSQICINLINIIKGIYKNTHIEYLNSSINSNYRKRFEIFKYRNLNDLHHAKDAYLTAVLGIYKIKWFREIDDYEFIKEINRELYKKGQYNKAKNGYFINSLDPQFCSYYRIIDKETGEVIDVDKINKFNDTIKYTMYRNDILVSIKTEIITGKFYDETIYSTKNNPKNTPIKKKISKNLIPLKKEISTKYGGYSSIKCSYCTLVKYKKGKKLIGIPYLIEVQNKTDGISKNNFIKKHLEISDNEEFTIIKDNIKFNSLIKLDDHEVLLRGYSIAHKKFEVINNVEFKIEKADEEKWKYSLNYIFNNERNSNQTDEGLLKDFNEIFEYIIYKIKKYYSLYRDLSEKIIEAYNSINEDVINNKKYFLLQLFNMLKCSSATASLKNYNLTDGFGRLNDKNIKDLNIIYVSPCGLRRIEHEF